MLGSVGGTTGTACTAEQEVGPRPTRILLQWSVQATGESVLLSEDLLPQTDIDPPNWSRLMILQATRRPVTPSRPSQALSSEKRNTEETDIF